MARVLFTTFGSYGDLHPYLAVGSELRKLGHRAVIATSANYRQKVEAQSLGFLPLRPDIDIADGEMMRYFFDRRRGTERVIRAMVSVVRETYEDTLAIAANFDVMVTHPTTLAAVLVAQKLKLPWVSSVLAPASFISAWDPPVPAPFPWIVNVRKLGPGAMRAVWKPLMRMVDHWLRPVHDLRREIGLGPGGNPLLEGGNSPDLVLALFSHLLAAPQPDWPPQVIVTGFPFFDESGHKLAREVEQFLQANPAPIVFTLGSSAVLAAGDFYAVSLKAVERVQARALFLTGSQPQELPSRLPENVMVWQYAPHEEVFRHAAAIVHQGGIGTTAQAMRAGLPMLVMPFAHDQYDNATRIQRLGAGIAIPRNKYREVAVANALRRLVSEKSYRQAAEAAGTAIRSESGALRAAQEIDRYLSGRSA